MIPFYIACFMWGLTVVHFMLYINQIQKSHDEQIKDVIQIVKAQNLTEYQSIKKVHKPPDVPNNFVYQAMQQAHKNQGVGDDEE